ncbi:alpha/beta fold hydrolase [Pleomorphomonas sp. JP5]|uniref:alpha/beta fold hydrolase n=1 Tax=Pleomorphomonas sp. JP5 TaxID=2942998 RepID=UPI0020435986|nr:alpha/beta hydrolase [Pleomorphomonas sp. JP5]MCM5557568.1 alpha/beta hydrolase [Pleomorphomonas sp. JP5]
MSKTLSRVADARLSPRLVSPAKTPAVLFTRTRLGVVQHSDDGDGPAFLALHGGMGGYDQSLILAEALLGKSPGYRVIALSRPGYLGTLPSPGDSSPEQQADLFAALMDTLGIERAIVAAVSAGGPSAIAFAARYRRRCAGLILVSTASGRLDVPDHVLKRLRWFGWLIRVPGLLPLLTRMRGRRPETAAARAVGDPALAAQTLAHPEAGPLLTALLDSTFDRLAARMPGTLADTMGFASLPPLPFAGVTAPTLAIHGDADKVVPFSHGERSAREIAGATLHVVPGGGHTCLFTHLDEVRESVRAFLARLGR